MTNCEALNEIKNLLAEIQEQEFVSVEELKNKLINVQEVADAAIAENC